MMFAGRYVWWVMMMTASFLFFAVYFDHVTWLVTVMSGCAHIAGSCGPIIKTMSGTIKPTGLWATGFVILFVTVGRFYYLRINQLWSLVFAAWLIMAAPFFFIVVDMFAGRLSPWQMLEAMPVVVPFVAGLVLYVSFPLDDTLDDRVRTSLLPLSAGLASAYVTLVSFAGLHGLPARLAHSRLLSVLVEPVAWLQAFLAPILPGPGNDPMIPWAFVMFSGSLALMLLIRLRPGLLLRLLDMAAIMAQMLHLPVPMRRAKT